MDDLFLDEQIPDLNRAVIKVVGVGGAGCNIIANMVARNINNVEYIAINTDVQASIKSGAETCVLISKSGLGATGRPEKGKEYAMESIDEIRLVIKDADMVIITASMGGGTGTGAAPVIAAEARASGALTVAVVSMPYTTADRKRITVAKEGLRELIDNVDSYIVVPNDFVDNTTHKLTFKESLKIADDIMCQSIQIICEMASDISCPIEIDFTDMRVAMSQKGKAFVGIGRASGENRAKQALESALKKQLLSVSDINIKGADTVLLNISGNDDDLLTDEVEEIQRLVNMYAGDDAHIIYGIIFDNRTDGSISVNLVATGIIDDDKGHSDVKKINKIEKLQLTNSITNMNDELKKMARERLH